MKNAQIYGILAASAFAVSAWAQNEAPSQQISDVQQEVESIRSRLLTPEESTAGAPRQSAQEVISDWKETPKKAATEMLSKYGQPDEVTSHRIIWHNKGPWKRTEVINEEIPHHFPMAHKDALEQTVNYKVPWDKFDDLAEYDGSVIVERTRGEISARCDKEPANFLALNLAHDIATGKKSVQEARDFYAKTIQQMMQGEKPSYTQSLQFQPSKQAAGDTDQPLSIIEPSGAIRPEQK